MFYLAYKFTHFQWHKQYCPATPSPPATYAKSGAPGSAPDNSHHANYQLFTRQPSQVRHNVAGPVPFRRRSCPISSQVKPQTVAGLQKSRHLRRKSATGAKKRRRSGKKHRPATQNSITCDTLLCHLRHSNAALRHLGAKRHGGV